MMEYLSLGFWISWHLQDGHCDGWATTPARTIGLPFGQRTYVVARSSASDIDQIVDSPGIARNIEERVATLRSFVGLPNVSIRRSPGCTGPKHVRR